MNEIPSIILNTCQPIFALDLDGKVTFWNNECEKLFGYSKDESLGKILPIISDGSAYELDTILEKAKQNKGIIFKTQKHSKSGEVLDIIVFTHPLVFNGIIVGLSATIQNSSLIKNATFMPYNLSPFVRDSKRTFYELRNELIITLSKGKMTINQIAIESGINWRTVEKHLTYLIGKKLASEVFSSEYVRVFELTEEGYKCVEELKKEGLARFIKTG